MTLPADSFVVEEGQVVGGQTLNTNGDTGLIEQGGTIISNLAPGVASSAGVQTITNNGTIITTGGGAPPFGAGIIVTGGSLATNNGSIRTYGTAAFGMLLTGPVPATIPGPTARNYGDIITSGAAAYGIAAVNAADRSTITNYGLIQTSGAAAYAVLTQSTDTTITNKGIIEATGVASAGVLSSGANTILTNSGTIVSTGLGSTAITFAGENPVLNLQRRSNIQGAVITVNPATLNVQKGLNLALTTSLGSNSFTTITTQGGLLAESGNLIAVVDRTGFAMEVDILDDLTSVIMNNLGSQYCFDCDECCDYYDLNDDWGAWVRGFGSYRERRLQHRTVDFVNGLEGGMAGLETTLFCDWKLGLFGGGSYGDAHVKHHTHVLKNTSGFGGLYLDGDFCGNFVRFAISGGSLNQRSKRKVMNNLVEGGVEYAKTKFNGGFVAPELRIGREFEIFSFKPIVSGDIRYSGLFLDSYKEKGSATNLSVKGHDIHLLTASTELAVPFTFTACDSCVTLTPYAGLEGRYRLGDKKLHGNLLDQSITFYDGSWNEIGIAFVGLRSCHVSQCGLTWMLDLEADFDNHKSALIRGGLKAEMSF